MDILALGERLLERRHIGHMRGEAKLNLAIIGGEQDIAGFGDKGSADAPANLSADRDILQVWIV